MGYLIQFLQSLYHNFFLTFIHSCMNKITWMFWMIRIGLRILIFISYFVKSKPSSVTGFGFGSIQKHLSRQMHQQKSKNSWKWFCIISWFLPGRTRILVRIKDTMEYYYNYKPIPTESECLSLSSLVLMGCFF